MKYSRFWRFIVVIIRTLLHPLAINRWMMSLKLRWSICSKCVCKRWGYTFEETFNRYLILFAFLLLFSCLRNTRYSFVYWKLILWNFNLLLNFIVWGTLKNFFNKLWTFYLIDQESYIRRRFDNIWTIYEHYKGDDLKHSSNWEKTFS